MESFVLFPVRCISCLKVLGALQIKYENLLLNGFSPGEALDKLEVKRYCCRTNILTSERIILPPRKKPYGILSEGLGEQDELTSINKKVDVELEYMQYALSEKIKDIFQTSLGDSQKYEAKNILERWILTLYNDLGPGPKSSPLF